MLTANMLFDLSRYRHASLFKDDRPVWSALQDLDGYLNGLSYPEQLLRHLSSGVTATEHVVLCENALIPGRECEIAFGSTLRGGLVVRKDGTILPGASLIMAGSVLQGARIAIGKGVLIEGGATVKSPTVIGDQSEIRQGAYIRGSCLIGDRCVVGHATELKHSIFLDDAKAGHFAYLGDSIVGNDANLGAGTKCANLRFIPGNVQILYQGKSYDSGMRKFGAIIGDKAQTGCNSVTSPGTIMGKKSILMPNSTAPSGFHEQRRIR